MTERVSGLTQWNLCMSRKFAICLFAGILACTACFAQKKVFDRGYDLKKPAALIAPKGSFTFGGSIGFGLAKQDNYDFLIVDGINANSHFVLVSPQFCYMIADNMGFGVRFNYKRNYLMVNSARAAIGETEIILKNYNYLKHQYQVAPFFRYYLPFGHAGRFAGFADMQLAVGGMNCNVVDSEGRGGFSRGFNASAGAFVGALAMLTAHLGIDVRLGLLEVTYSSLSQDNNVGSATEQIRTPGSARTLSGNFMFDLFSLSFGVHYYL